MISTDVARSACETYVNSLVASDLEAVLALFDDEATVEDPVGTDIKAGKEALREFYQIACNSVTAARMLGEPRVAGDEVAFPFEITIGMGEKAMKIEIIDVFRFNEAGKVVQMRAFWGKDNMGPAA